MLKKTAPKLFEVVRVKCLSDNYGWLVHSSGITACVDTPEVGPLVDAMEERGWKLDAILNTHHHDDHVGGNMELKKMYGCAVYGFEGDLQRLPGVTNAVKNNEIFRLAPGLDVTVRHTPGHTTGHITYHFPSEKTIFVGDTLFSMGCGRLFEGTPREMLESLTTLAALPDETLVYCAHEYTLKNAEFSISLDPYNVDLQDRLEEVRKLRKAGQATIPTTIGLERKTNPFLRSGSDGVRKCAGLGEGATELEVFTVVRGLRNIA